MCTTCAHCVCILYYIIVYISVMCVCIRTACIHVHMYVLHVCVHVYVWCVTLCVHVCPVCLLSLEFDSIVGYLPEYPDTLGDQFNHGYILPVSLCIYTSSHINHLRILMLCSQTHPNVQTLASDSYHLLLWSMYLL